MTAYFDGTTVQQFAVRHVVLLKESFTPDGLYDSCGVRWKCIAHTTNGGSFHDWFVWCREVGGDVWLPRHLAVAERNLSLFTVTSITMVSGTYIKIAYIVITIKGTVIAASIKMTDIATSDLTLQPLKVLPRLVPDKPRIRVQFMREEGKSYFTLASTMVLAKMKETAPSVVTLCPSNVLPGEARRCSRCSSRERRNIQFRDDFFHGSSMVLAKEGTRLRRQILKLFVAFQEFHLEEVSSCSIRWNCCLEVLFDSSRRLRSSAPVVVSILQLASETVTTAMFLTTASVVMLGISAGRKHVHPSCV